MSTIYKALTPHGAFQAEWDDDEESRVQYSGSADAIAYFKALLDLNSFSGAGGALIGFDSMEPADLYGFCQSEAHGITVFPTDDDLMDEFMESNMTDTKAVLDAVNPAEAFELIGEGAQILARLDENTGTFFPDLDRLRDIMRQLDEDTPADDGARAYLQSVIDGTVNLADPVVADELGKIHAAHAGDAAMLALFNTAAKAYVDYAVEQADAALAKG